MAFFVLLTDSAALDLEELYDYIRHHDAATKTEYILDHIEKIFNNLSKMPERGAFPKELLKLGVREYREIYFKPYRIIYRIKKRSVYILLIADGRRDIEVLLQRRLLEA